MDLEAVAPMCAKILEEETGNATGSDWLLDARLAVLNDLSNFLCAQGCQVEIFSSADDDELFLWISLGDPRLPAQDDERAMHFASANRYLLQTRFDKDHLSGINVIQDDPDPAYFEYSRHIVAEGEKRFFQGRSLFKQYSEGVAGVSGSILRTVDRVRLLRGIIERFMDLEAARGTSVIKSFYVPHKASKLEEFRCGQEEDPRVYQRGHDAWSNFRPRTIMWGLWGVEGQPLQEIRDYFGEPTAFYFLWLSYTVSSLSKIVMFFVPMIFYLGIRRPPWSKENRPPETMTGQRYLAIVYVLCAIIISLWTTLYTKGWTRMEQHYRVLWGMDMTETLKVETSPSYRGDLVPDPVNQTMFMKLYPVRKKIVVRLLAFFVTMIFLSCVLAFILVIFWQESELGGLGPRLLSAQVVISQLVWDHTAPELAKLMNPRNSAEEKNLAVLVRFPVSFICSYANVLFNSIYSTWGDLCVEEDCTFELRPDIFEVVWPVVFIQMATMLGPYLLYVYRVWEEQWHESRRRRAEGICKEIKRSFIETQSKRRPYGVRESNGDVNIMMILLGYVMLFGAIAPEQIIVVLIAFLVKIRIDAFKLCNVYQRVTPSLTGTTGLSSWNTVLYAMCMVGRGVTLAVPLINIGYLSASSGAVSCDDIDHGSLDRRLHSCAQYNSSQCNPSVSIDNLTFSIPGFYDDEDFTSAEMCCACRGGSLEFLDPLLAWLNAGDSSDGVSFVKKAVIWFVLKELFDRFAHFVDSMICDMSTQTTLIRLQRRHVLERFYETIFNHAGKNAKGGDTVDGQGQRRISVDMTEITKLDDAHKLWQDVDNDDFTVLEHVKAFVGFRSAEADATRVMRHSEASTDEDRADIAEPIEPNRNHALTTLH